MSTAAYRRARKAFMISNDLLGTVLVVDRRCTVDEPASVLVWTDVGQAHHLAEMPAKATEEQLAAALATAVATLHASRSILDIAAGTWHLAARQTDPAMAALEPQVTRQA